MSSWLSLTNELKRRCSVRNLTPVQNEVHDRLCRMMNVPEWINLCGPLGSGKTYLAWTISQSIGASYVSTPRIIDQMKGVHQSIIVDNAPYKEYEVRRIFSQCDLLGIQTVLLVTRSQITLPLLRVELPNPSASDIKQVGRLINHCGFFLDTRTLPEKPNFWDVLLASI